MLIISQTNALINPTVVQEVSKNVKYIPNVNPFMSQWDYLINKKWNKNDLFTVWCEQLCDCVETCNLSSFENVMKISVIWYIYYNIGFIT